MKKFKKSAAGPVAVYQLLSGETGKISSGLNVKAAGFSLRAMIQISDCKTDLSGLRNGF